LGLSVFALIEIEVSFMAESGLLPKRREKPGWSFNTIVYMRLFGEKIGSRTR